MAILKCTNEEFVPFVRLSVFPLLTPAAPADFLSIVGLFFGELVLFPVGLAMTGETASPCRAEPVRGSTYVRVSLDVGTSPQLSKGTNIDELPPTNSPVIAGVSATRSPCCVSVAPGLWNRFPCARLPFLDVTFVVLSVVLLLLHCGWYAGVVADEVRHPAVICAAFCALPP